MSKEKETNKKFLKKLLDQANREILSETSQKEIKKEAQKRGLSDAELKDLRTKYQDLTKATGKYRGTYAPRFKKGGSVKKKNKMITTRGFGASRKT
tara:strand:- start:597 stop:884 length:288 start_codon:yes stop_codon:yes gene_type:complete